MATKIINKLSVKAVFGGKGPILDKVMGDKTKAHPIVRFLGIATGMKTGEGDNGPWTGLTGQFKGINLDTGEEFRSGVLFMPNVAQDMVIGALMGDTKAVEFGFEVTAQYDEASATSYAFGASPLFESAESDPLKMLESKIAAQALEDKGGDGGKKDSGKKK